MICNEVIRLQYWVMGDGYWVMKFNTVLQQPGEDIDL